MEWWAALLKILGLKSANADEFKSIIAAYRQLNEDYKLRVTELEKELKHLKDMTPESMNPGEVKELLDKEGDYLIQILNLEKEKRDLREEIIFLKGMIKEEPKK